MTADILTRVRSNALRPAVLVAAASVFTPAYAQAQIQRTSCDDWQRVDEIFAAMDVGEGDHVADIGAGAGFFTFRLSRRVGPQGMVYAVDIDESVLREVREAALAASIENIAIVFSEPDDPTLPDQSVDAVLIVNSYHEMTEYGAMLAGIKRALRPEGRLVIVDMPAADPTASRATQSRQHRLDIGIAEQDLAESGFEVIRREPDFVNAGRRRNWMLVAVVSEGSEASSTEP